MRSNCAISWTLLPQIVVPSTNCTSNDAAATVPLVFGTNGRLSSWNQGGSFGRGARRRRCDHSTKVWKFIPTRRANSR